MGTHAVRNVGLFVCIAAGILFRDTNTPSKAVRVVKKKTGTFGTAEDCSTYS